MDRTSSARFPPKRSVCETISTSITAPSFLRCLPDAEFMPGLTSDTFSRSAFVANLELRGEGTFFDRRLTDASQFPVAAKAGFGNKRSGTDMVTAKLAALHYYQLSIPAPRPPTGSFDSAAAARGEALFKGKATCAQCHVPPLFTEPGWNTHKPSEIGIDDFQSNRSPDKTYRTAPLRGLFAHMK